MSIINLLANDVWSEADILSHGRTVIASVVSEARQNELRTIMLGHIAGMRVATDDELVEISTVQAATEAQVVANAAARADMALLQSVLSYESAESRLALPPVLEPLTIEVTDEQGVVTQVANPAIEQDASERLVAEGVIASADAATLALYALRHPIEIPAEVLL